LKESFRVNFQLHGPPGRSAMIVLRRPSVSTTSSLRSQSTSMRTRYSPTRSLYASTGLSRDRNRFGSAAASSSLRAIRSFTFLPSLRYFRAASCVDSTRKVRPSSLCLQASPRDRLPRADLATCSEDLLNCLDAEPVLERAREGIPYELGLRGESLFSSGFFQEPGLLFREF